MAGSVVLVTGHCYAELTISSLAVAMTTASTNYAIPPMDGQAKLAWMAWQDGIPVSANGNPST